MSKALHLISYIAMIACCSLPVIASAAELSTMHKYLETIAYKKELMRVTTHYAMQTHSCSMANPQLVRLRYHILTPVEFTKDLPNPTKGAWFEETRVIVCHTTQAYDVTAIADENGELPDFSVAPAKIKNSKP